MNLSIPHLQAQYRESNLTPTQLVKQLDAEIGEANSYNIWIRRLSLDEMLVYANNLQGKDPASLPLYGIPFAIKDNIDLAGIPTTAACPDFAFTPEKSATVVQKLIEAGAIPVGKTNLDQFATGLVGTRSPFGACKNSINPAYISGGSSAGSAVSVALNMVSFSLGTDTAGSGRVPAALNNLVGVKPSLGLLSTSGVLPACRTLDCVSIFAKNAVDAETVIQVAQGFDVDDAYSRQTPNIEAAIGNGFVFGVPKPSQLAFFGNAESAQLFQQAIEKLEKVGGKSLEIDFAPFIEAAKLLYEGPWVAERYAAIKDFFDAKPEAIFPTTYKIISNAAKFSATDTFNAMYKLKALQRKASKAWETIDVLVTPTAGTIYTIAEVQADPMQTNTNLGYYTNFMNLLDMAAIAVPTGFYGNGIGFGITLSAPAFSDDALLNLAKKL
jgi:allophanate hydrolase